ncbi:MAG: hypothetical protein IPM31_09195 [Anaerolineae bacterium]|nr:hypothetical protein [Anaerolineae bacterium]MBL8104382.1 hypothetical protein [Anaerolineales bacterium]MCC7188849.1 hypothetical protein [Anaerolineales bacterium]
MTETGEITIFEDDKVKITNLRAIIGTKTYAISNVTSVSKSQKAASNIPFLLVIVGAFFIFLGIVGIREFWGFLIIGLIIAILGIRAVNTKPAYIVKIGSASGETNILVSEDGAYIKRIVDAMNDAIVRRG